MNTQATPKRTRARRPNNRTTTRLRVSDELWAVLAPILPVHKNTHRCGGGRPRVPDRQCADAIFSVLRSGGQWAALNETELCANSTAHDRFSEWVEAGVCEQRWQAGRERFDDLKGIAWSWLALDGAMTKAPLGGEKDRAKSDRPRQSGRQPFAADGEARHTARTGDGWRQPPRSEVGAGHD